MDNTDVDKNDSTASFLMLEMLCPSLSNEKKCDAGSLENENKNLRESLLTCVRKI